MSSMLSSSVSTEDFLWTQQRTPQPRQISGRLVEMGMGANGPLVTERTPSSAIPVRTRDGEERIEAGATRIELGCRLDPGRCLGRCGLSVCSTGNGCVHV
jgi:hypothetical protein